MRNILKTALAAVILITAGAGAAEAQRCYDKVNLGYYRFTSWTVEGRSEWEYKVEDNFSPLTESSLRHRCEDLMNSRHASCRGAETRCRKFDENTP